MDTKKMLQDGFVKKTVAVLIEKDRNGKEHIVVVDTPEHAKFYKTGGDTSFCFTWYCYTARV